MADDAVSLRQRATVSAEVDVTLTLEAVVVAERQIEARGSVTVGGVAIAVAVVLRKRINVMSWQNCNRRALPMYCLTIFA